MGIIPFMMGSMIVIQYMKAQVWKSLANVSDQNTTIVMDDIMSDEVM